MTKAAAKKVPAALARVDARAHASREERLAREGRADLLLIKRRRARITEDFYDVGEALVRLKRPGVAQALGYRGFAELCAGELQMSVSKANQLIAIVLGVRREDAVSFGQDRAAALLALADATPEDDTPATLERTSYKLPSGRVLRVAQASARELLQAAKEIRAAHRQNVARPRGRTTTAAERATCASLQRALRELGAETARVSAVATRPGREGNVRIEGVPIAMLGLVAKAIRVHRRP